MTANIYYHRWWKPLAFLAGCFPAQPHNPQQQENKYGVGKAVTLINQGYSLMMFPEGKRTRTRIPAKPGISRIVSQVKNPVMLCRIEWKNNNKNTSVNIIYEVADKNIEMDNSDEIMDSIYSLTTD